MNVLQKKIKLNDQVMKTIELIRFKRAKVKLSGTASLNAMKYFSDYDFISHVTCKYKAKTICDEFKRILNGHLNDLYFIEFKIEYDDGKKKKLYDVSHLKTSLFKNINFVKIDYIIRYENVFKELTIIYLFNAEKQSKEDMLKQVRYDYNVLKSERKYYKALKRLFSTYKIKKKYNKLIELTKFFNDTGDKYEVVSNLKTIQALLKRYDDHMTIKKVMINLNDIGLVNNDICETITEYENELNKSAIKYIV